MQYSGGFFWLIFLDSKISLKRKLPRYVKKYLYLRHRCELFARQTSGHFMTDVLELSAAKLRHYKDFFHISRQ